MALEQRVQNLLKKNQLSVTDSRSKILELFLKNSGALAHSDIESKSGLSFDRVTVYRTLQTFVEKGIIHTIPTADNAVRYALCKDDCTEGHHHDHHIHFLCTKCGNTTCLEDIHVPEVMLPQGFSVQHVEVVVNGICRNCR